MKIISYGFEQGAIAGFPPNPMKERFPGKAESDRGGILPGDGILCRTLRLSGTFGFAQTR